MLVTLIDVDEMKTKKRDLHLTRWVILGYASIALLVVFAIFYISALITQIRKEETKENPAREKAAIVTNTLVLLFESETYAQSLDASGDKQITTLRFNQTFEEISGQLELLRGSLSDTAKSRKIDEIEMLLEQKRINTLQLLKSRQEMEQLYSKSFAQELTEERKKIKEIELQTQNETRQDTLLIQREKKGFLKRLAEAFVPVKADTTLLINSTSHQQVDSLVTEYDPTDAVTSVLQKLQNEIIDRRENINKKLMAEADNLRTNNNVITSKINLLLLEIREEETIASNEQEIIQQDFLNRALTRLAAIALAAMAIILLFLFLILKDISKGRYYQKQLEEANRFAADLLQSREKFMLMISHDIRSPLSSILGYIELLIQNRPNEEQKGFLENMTLSARHILTLVNDLLDFHRLESGQMEIHPYAFNFPVLFEAIHAGFKPLTNAKGLGFPLEIIDSEKGEWFEGDPVRIRQVVGNLLSNAIKFTSKGSIYLRVWIEPSDTECMLCVAVRDEGPGISEADQKRIFQEFTRLDGSEKEEGFGLGLSITYKLVALMNGTITLTSHLGKGSEFIVHIPLTEASEENIAAEEASIKKEVEQPMPVFERKINCLVIDDDVLQLKFVEILLKRNHINVIPSSDPRGAIELLRIASFDVILTDIQMPGEIDGYALLKLIRTSGIPGADTIPVIALSGSLAEEKEHYTDAGFAGFLNKPFTGEALINFLNTLFPQTPMTAEAETVFNFASLTTFADGNAAESEAILQTFVVETHKNADLLGKALKNKDRKQASKLSHKLIPLFTMLEAHELVQLLRIVEINDPLLPETDWEKTVGKAISRINIILDSVHTVE
ncbi:hybrid sensor histidine kinase/response regulator [Bacteroidia bacterium]|nr:hybrid sensor histidine kinase/response regulator [Bacteroidia bacterium]